MSSALATAVATSVLAVFGLATVAHASIGGTGGTLTSSNGTKAIKFAGGTTLTVAENVTDVGWSPDASRAVFVTDSYGIDTVRYDNGANVLAHVDPDPAIAVRAHPTWRGDGSTLVWAERPTDTQLWRIMVSNSSPGWNVSRLSPKDGASYTHPDAGPGQLVVFQRQAYSAGAPSGQPEAWLLDPAAGSTPETMSSVLVTDARNPALSPDATKVAFVRSDGTRDQIYVFDRGSGTTWPVTTDAANHNNPVWSPDASTIAFNIGTTTVATAPADGSAPPTTVLGLSGMPAYAPQNASRVVRLSGVDRFATAVAVSQSYWATAGASGDSRTAAKSVVLSRSDTFADALSGSTLATAKQGPLLMTPPDALNATTKVEISRVLGSRSLRVYLLGGVGAISLDVENEIRAMGYTPARLAGIDRYATSVAIANEVTPTPELILAATGVTFPDALAAGAAAGYYNLPAVDTPAVVVLTADATLPLATKAYLDSHVGTTLFAIGRQAAIATSAYGSISVGGVDRYETAWLTAEVFFGGERFAGIATGTNWPDALAGGALMGTLGGPMLLTEADDTLNDRAAYLLDETSGSVGTGVIFGATSVVSGAIDAQIGQLISGPGGYGTVANPTTVATQPSVSTTVKASTFSTSTGTATHRQPSELRAAAKAALERR